MRTLVVGLFDLREARGPRCVGRSSDPKLTDFVCQAIHEERLQDVERLESLNGFQRKRAVSLAPSENPDVP